MSIFVGDLSFDDWNMLYDGNSKTGYIHIHIDGIQSCGLNDLVVVDMDGNILTLAILTPYFETLALVHMEA